MKIKASQLRQIIREEVTRALAEAADYTSAAKELLAAGTEELESEDLEASSVAFIELFKNAIAPIADDEEAVGDEMDAALGALKAAGAKRSDVENARDALRLVAAMVAADLEASADEMDYEIESARRAEEQQKRGAAKEAVIERLGRDRSFMMKVIPLMNAKIAAKSSKDKSAASKAVTAAIAAAMTDEEMEIIDPVRVHGIMFDRLQAYARRKAGR